MNPIVAVVSREVCSCGPSRDLANKDQELNRAGLAVQGEGGGRTLTSLACTSYAVPRPACCLRELRQHLPPPPLRLQGCRNQRNPRAPQAGGTRGVVTQPPAWALSLRPALRSSLVREGTGSISVPRAHAKPGGRGWDGRLLGPRAHKGGLGGLALELDPVGRPVHADEQWGWTKGEGAFSAGNSLREGTEAGGSCRPREGLGWGARLSPGQEPGGGFAPVECGWRRESGGRRRGRAGSGL